MGILSILLIITVAWFIYHFVMAYNARQVDREKLLHRLGYGKAIGLFALVTGIMGQLVGLTAMFDAIENEVQRGNEIMPVILFGGIKATMIVTIYGILIYLLALLLWFVASIIIEKKHEN